MAGLKYLWFHRSKNKFLSKAFIVSWAKRVLTLNELLINNKRRKKLINKGANISETAEVGIVNIGGNKSNLTVGYFSCLGRVEIALHDKVSIGSYVCIR